jgi:hypothetical protein
MAVNNRDYLNVIERKIIDELRIFFNGVDGSATNPKVFVTGQFPEAENLKFPSVVVQQIGSGHEEQFIGSSVTMGGNSYIGEILGVGFVIHILIDKETEIDIAHSGISAPQGSAKYRQRRLLNWMMLNISNVINDIDWATAMSSHANLSYDPNYDASVEVLERHLQAWREVGFNVQFQWWGASAQMMIVFKNYR